MLTPSTGRLAEARVRQLFASFWATFHAFLGSITPQRAVACALLGTDAHWTLIGACNPILCPNWGFRTRFCEWWDGFDRASQRKLLMRATQDTMQDGFTYTKNEIDELHAAVKELNRASLFEFNVAEMLDHQCKCASGRRSAYPIPGRDFDRFQNDLEVIVPLAVGGAAPVMLCQSTRCRRLAVGGRPVGNGHC